MGFESRTLGDVVTLVRGTTYKSALLGQPGPFLLGLASIQRNGGFRSDSLKTYGGESKEKLLLLPGDLFVSLKDVTQSADLLGAIARVPVEVELGRLTQDTVKLEFRDDSYPPALVYWALRSPNFREYCRAHATGTTNLGLPREDFLAYEMPVPAPGVLSLVQLLESIEKRITLLGQTTATLETIANVLFKSWFVDFDPVRFNAEGREPEGMDATTAALFPSEFEDSELGSTPKGWTVRRIEDVAEKVAMGPFGSNIKVSTFVEAGVPVISGQHLKQTLLEDLEYNFITQEHAARLSGALVHEGDIVFTHAGNIGQVSIIPKGAAYDMYVLSQRQFYLRCNQQKVLPEYLAYYFRTFEGQHRLLANASQVGVPSIARPVSYLKSLEVVIPPMSVMELFTEAATAIHCGIVNGRRMTKTLSDLRDTLLPRLISGKLRLPEAEAILEEALA